MRGRRSSDDGYAEIGRKGERGGGGLVSAGSVSEMIRALS